MLAPKMEDDMNRNQVTSIQVQSSPIATALGLLTFPCTICASCWVLEPQTEAIVLNFGILTEIHDKPGCQCSNCWGIEIKKISTAQLSQDLPEQKITDSHGNPINVSAVITYRFTNPVAALLSVSSPVEYVNTQAGATLKQVVGKYTYMELKNEASEISKELVSALQPRVTVAGATIFNITLNELNYAPEIAQAMLKKQAAQAQVEARQLIVKGAVEIAFDAIDQLEKKGMKMDDKEKFHLVSNLLIVTAGDKDATPTLSM